MFAKKEDAVRRVTRTARRKNHVQEGTLPDPPTDVKGFLRVPRAWLDSMLKRGQRFTQFEALLDLMGLARWGRGRHTVRVSGRVYEIGYGELVTSTRILAVRWSWPRSTVHDFLHSPDTQAFFTGHQTGHQTTHLSLSLAGAYNDAPLTKPDTKPDTDTEKPVHIKKKDLKEESIKKKEEEEEDAREASSSSSSEKPEPEISEQIPLTGVETESEDRISATISRLRELPRWQKGTYDRKYARELLTRHADKDLIEQIESYNAWLEDQNGTKPKSLKSGFRNWLKMSDKFAERDRQAQQADAAGPKPMPIPKLTRQIPGG